MVLKKDTLLIDHEMKYLLYCPSCLSEFSANYNDYFLLNDTDEIICGRCKGEMYLVSKHITYKLVQESGDNNDGSQRKSSRREGI